MMKVLGVISLLGSITFIAITPRLYKLLTIGLEGGETLPVAFALYILSCCLFVGSGLWIWKSFENK